MKTQNTLTKPFQAVIHLMFAALSIIYAADITVVNNITSNSTWTADNDYLLGKPIFVTDGAILTIEPGTRIYGYEDEGAGTFGSLIVTRGCQIVADGTRQNPIVFTALDERDQELSLDDSGLWGGLVLLGEAVLNDANNPYINPNEPSVNTREIEGFPSGGAGENIKYGGLDDDDNSGILRYVSIRYGGYEFQPDEEINGLTLGAVGRGTTIEHVEVYNNSDDGIEFFGGTVNTRYMVMAFNEDEAFDMDQGYRGSNQFWFAIQKAEGNGSNYLGEHDGGDSPNKTFEPFARAKVYNATYLGSGRNANNPQENGAFRLKDNFAGQYHNSIVGDVGNYIVRIDDDSTKERADTAGDLQFANNLWFDVATYDGSPESLTKNSSAEELKVVAENGNVYANPFLAGISRRPHGGLDPRPLAEGAAFSTSLSEVPNDGFLVTTAYKGAFSSSDNWMLGWTYLDEKGYLSRTPTTTPSDEIVESDITTPTVWTNEKIYILEKPVFVKNNSTLTIEAGTTVLGMENEDLGTFGSIIVTRGSKIFAEGTRNSPITMTAKETQDSSVDLTVSSLWGGLILLGNAILNDADNPIVNPDAPVINEREIEGFPSGGEAGNIMYGGDNDADNSGILRYVSIRNGGYEFQVDEEINGLTLGAVGSGTTIEFVEVFNNSDDGVEFFGGTVDSRYMVMAYNEDEAFDIDQGYRGRGQFWFSIQKDVGNGSNYGGEHDGGDSPTKTIEPFARAKVYNATYIGSGVGGSNPQDNWTFRLKDNFAGQYHNSVFTDFKDGAIRVDDDPTRMRINEGELAMHNNHWFGFGEGNGTDLADWTKNATAEELLLLDPARGNTVENPQLRGISRETDGGLDPRPASDSPVYSAAMSSFPVEQNGFFEKVDFRGAFGEINWMKDWTALDQLNYTNTTSDSDVEVTENISSDTTWTADKSYLLKKPVFVTDGATLTIEPGTTIYGYEDLGAGTFGSLIVTRGSKISAIGTAENPIVFTALAERERELNLSDTSLWGGLIILGNAILNDADNSIMNPDNPEVNTREIEGFPSGGADDNIKYGGDNDADNSGTLKYVSIRYGGYEFQSDEEINGLTLGAVGSGTTIEYVEVYNNSDDGIEFFGGTVNTRYMVMAFNEDEAFDIDQGYRGTNQFWFAIQKAEGNGSNYTGEHDGGDSPNKILEPFARAKVYNATFLGSGRNANNPQDNGAFRLKDNFAGQYHNSIFGDVGDYAVRIDDNTTAERANTPGDLLFANNLWFDVASYNGTPESLTKNGSASELKVVSENGNTYANPFLAGISRRPYGGLDPRPIADGPAFTATRSEVPDDGYLVATNYRGAFSADNNWMRGWTHLDGKGYLAKDPVSNPSDVVVDQDITTDTVWTNDRTYLVNKPVFVKDGANLTIEAGTTILGSEDGDAGTFGSIVVTRGSKIFAEGTRDYPIVMTAIDERDGTVDLTTSSLWGGLVMLGNAILNDADNPIVNPDSPLISEREIEGFPSGGADANIKYGGDNDEDNSGTLRFVSIRNGGYEFQVDEEINGLTLGAVGSGTTIEFVEVFNNSDDGVEFFGGTVDSRYMVMAYNEDEAFDIDQGYRGRGQFWFSIQKDVGNGSNYGGEHDGGDSPTKTIEPFARAKVYNATYIGSGVGGANPQDNWTFRLKDNFAGQYHNSVFTDFKDGAIRVDDDPTKMRINEGELAMHNNHWFGFGEGDGTDLAALTKNQIAEELLLLDPARGNVVEDPKLGGIGRTMDTLDPRPLSDSPLFDAMLSDFPANQAGFFTNVEYRGAFGDVNWADGWSALSAHFTDGRTGGVDPNSDADGDGQTFAQEQKAGTDPNNASDYLRVTNVTRMTDGNFNVSWETKNGINYEVEYSPDLVSGWTSIGSMSGDGTIKSLTDNDAARIDAEQGYYRVRVP